MKKKDEGLIATNLKSESISISPGDILFLKIQNGFVHIYLNRSKDSIIVQDSLSSLGQQLSTKLFFRIHRNCIVHLEYVEDYGQYPGHKLVVQDNILVLARRRRMNLHTNYLIYKKLT